MRFECRVDSTNNLDWQECTSPVNLLDMFASEDPQVGPGEHTFEVRAIDMAEPPFEDPNNPDFDGNVDPTPAKYTWTMTRDTTPPTTGITAGPAPGERVGLPESIFEFAGEDNATPLQEITYECQLDAEPTWAPCESPTDASSLLPGSHTFRVRAIDLAMNVDATPASRTWTVVAMPVTTITSGPGTLNTEGTRFSTEDSAIFAFDADQDGVTFECSLDEGGVNPGDVDGFFPCVSPVAYRNLDNGEHTFEVRATNPEGVIEEPPVLYEWSVELGPDTVPPNTNIIAGPGASSPLSIATFEFTGSDNRAGDLSFECSLDGAGFNSCTSPEEFSDLLRGPHVLLVRAIDVAGFPDPTPARYEWAVSPPPVTFITHAPAEETESRVAEFTFVSDTPGVTYWCWLDGVLEENCSSPKQYTGLADGEHLFAVLARDQHGTFEDQWVDYEWVVGRMTAPLVYFEETPPVESESGRAEFKFASNAEGVSFLCSFDGSDPLPCTSPYVIPRAAAGEHEFEVVAQYPPVYGSDGELLDLLYEEVPSVYNWTVVDFTPPDTAIRYGPASVTSSIDAYFGFAASDGAAMFECSVDWQDFGGCEANEVFQDLLPGEHRLLVRAVDEAQNADRSPALYTWTVVRETPNTPVGRNVTVELPVPGPGTGTATFFEVGVAGATHLDQLPAGPPVELFGYGVGGGRYYDIGTTADVSDPVRLCLPYNPAEFTLGPARLLQYDGADWSDVTVTNDATAGRLCGEPKEFGLFAIATGINVPPLAMVLSGPDQISESGSATFAFAADIPGARLQCSIDGLPFVHCESPMTYKQLATGDHKFEVQAMGFSGEPVEQLIPALYEWEVALPIDTTPPDTRIVKGAPSLTSNATVMFEFTGIDDQTLDLDLEFECLLDGVLLGSCASVLSTPGIPGVPYEVEVEEGAFGEHTLAIRAIDEIGNVDPSPATRTWTYVDLTAPDTEIEIGPEEETTGTVGALRVPGRGRARTARARLRVLARRRGLRALHVAAHRRGPGGRPAHLPGPRGQRVRDGRPDAGDSRVADRAAVRHRPARHDDRHRSRRGLRSGRDLRLPEQRAGRGLPVRARQRVVQRLRLRPRARGPRGRRAHGSGCARSTSSSASTRRRRRSRGPWSASPTRRSRSARPRSAAARARRSRSTPTSPTSLPVLGRRVDADPVPVAVRRRAADAGRARLRGLRAEQLPLHRRRAGPWTSRRPSGSGRSRTSTPPDTTIVSMTFLGPTDLVEPESFRFELRGTDNATAWFELEFECSLDDGPWEGCDAAVPLPAARGSARRRARAAGARVDDFENVDPTPATHTFDDRGGAGDDDRVRARARDRDTEATFSSRPTPRQARRSSARSTGAVRGLPVPVHARRAARRARAAGAGDGPDGRRRPHSGRVRLGASATSRPRGSRSTTGRLSRPPTAARPSPSPSTTPTRGCAARSTAPRSTGASRRTPSARPTWRWPAGTTRARTCSRSRRSRTTCWPTRRRPSGSGGSTTRRRPTRRSSSTPSRGQRRSALAVHVRRAARPASTSSARSTPASSRSGSSARRRRRTRPSSAACCPACTRCWCARSTRA